MLYKHSLEHSNIIFRYCEPEFAPLDVELWEDWIIGVSLSVEN